jgi:uncharacterized membrane protein YgdD (TMEM256/DUF423 family)
MPETAGWADRNSSKIHVTREPVALTAACRRSYATPSGNSRITTMQRSFILAGGLLGAAGVALSAVAAHAGGGNVGTAAGFLLAHAPVLLAIGLHGRGRLLDAGGTVLLAGVLLFCGDLLMRHYTGGRLFPMAAPIGGTATILGWLIVAASAFTLRKGG